MQPQHTGSDPAFSVLIISSDRDIHLANAVRGIGRSTRPPAEIVVCYMDQPAAVPPASDIPLRVVHVAAGPGGPLPLGAARNAAAAAARSGILVFLDVDCIPAADMFDQLLADLDRTGGLVMATPRYLTADAGVQDWASGSGDDLLYRDSVPHHARAALAPAQGEAATLSQEYALFWSLGFAVHRHTFGHIGGFDESFAGYGGEDTDFAFTARREAIPLAFSAAVMFHQHHGVHRPPLQHLESIVVNAVAFRRKWGGWPMTGWLEAFARAGYVAWDRDGGSLRLLRRPGPAELAAARVNEPY